MKGFDTYQYVEGEVMTERDRQEVGSKFWNQGKWDNFVKPFLPKDASDMTLVDMGCNAGIFLKLAEDMGFKRVIGVDSSKEAIRKGIAYRERNGGKYELIRKDMTKCIDELPMTDYTVLAMAHYYFPINDWLDYMDKIWSKSRYVIIVTALKKSRPCKASADTIDIRNYFKNWEEVGYIPELPLEGDPFPRRQWSFCFKNPVLDRVPIEEINLSNKVQVGFYGQLDKKINVYKTKYYRVIKAYRKNWSQDRKTRFIAERVDLYADIKKNGLLRPIIIAPTTRVIDGNHRLEMLRHLGEKTVIIRRA